MDDYQYDANGNMISDQNKQITSITYNHLNLPKKVTFTGNYKYIEYVYDATGVKLKKLVSSMNSNNTVENATTEYLGGFQYTSVAGAGGLALQFFPNAEGYVKNTVINSTNNYNYVYNYTDHLGNIRLSYAYDDQTGNVQPLDEHHYYPFGLELVNILNTAKMEFKGEPYTYVEPSTGKTVTITKPMIVQVANSGYQYQYQGQERQDELNLNWDSFKYRNYDYAIARFFNIDPLSEKYVYNGVYNFSENRVIDGRELEGLEVELINPNRKRGGNIDDQKRSKNNDERIVKGFRTLSYGDKLVTVLAHGGTSGMSNDFTGKRITNAKQLNDVLKRNSEAWKNKESNDGMTVVLYSCRTGSDKKNKKGESVDIPFAQKISASPEFKDVEIIAPDQRLYINENGVEGTYEAKYTDEDDEYKTDSQGEIISKERSDTPGSWVVYKNGEEIRRIEGNKSPNWYIFLKNEGKNNSPK